MTSQAALLKAATGSQEESDSQPQDGAVVNEISKQQIIVCYLKVSSLSIYGQRFQYRPSTDPWVSQSQTFDTWTSEVDTECHGTFSLQDSLSFATQIQSAVPIICQLLSSKTNSDVLEAIEFFVTGVEFGVDSAVIGVRQMLGLVWSKESTIKDTVATAYKRLYLKPDATNTRYWTNLFLY